MTTTPEAEAKRFLELVQMERFSAEDVKEMNSVIVDLFMYILFINYTQARESKEKFLEQRFKTLVDELREAFVDAVERREEEVNPKGRA